MEERPNYYAVIPANIRYDDNLKDKAKLLYGEISALSNQYGYCYASNKYFANLYKVSTTTISTLIKNLIDCGYIESEYTYKNGTKEIDKRYLKIFKGGYLKNFKGGIKENLKDNNTSINITSINKYNIYGEFKNVKLTDEEYQKIKDKNLLPYIEKLSSYIASKGKRYKSHYATILTWSRKTDDKQEILDNFNQNNKIEKISKEEQNELENILKEIGE